MQLIIFIIKRADKQEITAKQMAALNPNNQQQADKRIIGFDCEFVKPPPSEYIQSECPVCLQIIR